MLSPNFPRVPKVLAPIPTAFAAFPAVPATSAALEATLAALATSVAVFVAFAAVAAASAAFIALVPSFKDFKAVVMPLVSSGKANPDKRGNNGNKDFKSNPFFFCSSNSNFLNKRTISSVLVAIRRIILFWSSSPLFLSMKSLTESRLEDILSLPNSVINRRSKNFP